MISFYSDLLYDIRSTNADLTNFVFDGVFNQFWNEFATLRLIMGRYVTILLTSVMGVT